MLVPTYSIQQCIQTNLTKRPQVRKSSDLLLAFKMRNGQRCGCDSGAKTAAALCLCTETLNIHCSDAQYKLELFNQPRF